MKDEELARYGISKTGKNGAELKKNSLYRNLRRAKIRESLKGETRQRRPLWSGEGFEFRKD